MSKIFLLLKAIWFWLFIIIISTSCYTLSLLFALYAHLTKKSTFTYANYVIQLFCKIAINGIYGVKYTLINKEYLHNIQKPVIYIINHLSYGDILFLYLLDLECSWFIKKSLLKVPVIGWGMRVIKCVPVMPNSLKEIAKSMQIAKQVLKQKCSLAIFPEGTRSLDGRLQKFKNGAFKLAIQEQLNIVPITIEGTEIFLPKNSLIPSKAHVKVTVHKAIYSQNKKVQQLEEECWQYMNSVLPNFMQNLKEDSVKK